MKKIGSLQFFEDVDLNLKFNFNELMSHFKGDELGIKQNLLDENENLKMDKLEQFVEAYVNQKIQEKYGKDYSLDTMDDTMNISWDINIGSIKKHHKEKWWNKEK
tara:strand:+ start:348 stop:662 length:315 start_codon:yes stop_codon:yes gene_type:complete